LRFADGPDEVHRNQLAKLELAKHLQSAAKG
jgi:acyl-CoA dehydrogenase